MHDTELWDVEEQFWTAGPEFYEQRLDAGVLMVVPSYGALDRRAVIDLVRQRRCCKSAILGERLSLSPSHGVAVLAYTVNASKVEGNYHARCNSTYVRIDGAWLLAMHHQSRVAQPHGEHSGFFSGPALDVAARVFGPAESGW